MACTGGLTSPKFHSYAGNCPLGCIYHSRPSSTSCRLANSGSTNDNATQWNPRSHAANQGYSHLSGIDNTSSLLRCCQSWFRPFRRCAGGGGCPGSPCSQSKTL